KAKGATDNIVELGFVARLVVVTLLNQCSKVDVAHVHTGCYAQGAELVVRGTIGNTYGFRTFLISQIGPEGVLLEVDGCTVGIGNAVFRGAAIIVSCTLTR